MACFECHTEEEMHGTEGDYNHRYDGPLGPSCSAEGCHDDVSPDDDIEQHDEVHLAKMSCETCHSVAYKNCYNCHVQQTDDGRPFYRVEPSRMAFKIGRNPRQSPERPWEYVPLRHVPIARDSFVYYGEDLLPNFDSLPTWAYATPHNTQLITPQNASCDSCHSNSDVFLTEDDVLQDELAANEDVIVREVPPLP
jgi:thiosulfate/3-mercaptopyruvate sulfurtransferase